MNALRCSLPQPLDAPIDRRKIARQQAQDPTTAAAPPAQAITAVEFDARALSTRQAHVPGCAAVDDTGIGEVPVVDNDIG